MILYYIILYYIMLYYGKRQRQASRKRQRVDWQTFRTHAGEMLGSACCTQISQLETKLIESADASRLATRYQARAWDTAELQSLRVQRQWATGSMRAELSKLIWRKTRQRLRMLRTEQARRRLEEFKRLKDLDRIHMHPIKRKCAQQPDLDKCAAFLQEVYASDLRGEPQTAILPASLANLPRIRIEEVRSAVDHMAMNKSGDAHGVCLEMFAYAGETCLGQLTDLYNKVVDQAVVPESWRESHFTLLTKPGDVTDPGNWRPIALLSISYKIFARILYTRLRPTLDREQSDDQFGFRPSRSAVQALIVLENLVAKGIEWNIPVWIISIDLKKAFDRIEQAKLFRSMLAQGVENEYVSLLSLLYQEQTGILSDSKSFPVRRGVRQGDVLSPLLFNAALEQAMRQWKGLLASHGFALVPDRQAERLTNIRYADDLLLMGKSLEEVVEMMELLVQVLEEFGLSINVKKTMVMCTVDAPTCKTFVDTNVGFLELLTANGLHKYLGRAFCGDLRRRNERAVEHRVSCGWAKFRNLQQTLSNKNISIKLRLRLFEAVVTPTVLYSLESVALTDVLTRKLDTTQRCMLRKILGWISYDGETFEESGRRMKKRLESALAATPLEDWSSQIQHRKDNLKSSMADAPRWVRLSFDWCPSTCAGMNGGMPARNVGRPPTRW